MPLILIHIELPLAAIMAHHSLAIAKASFAAGMMRPDPTSLVPRAEISRLEFLLENALHSCTPSNIQV